MPAVNLQYDSESYHAPEIDRVVFIMSRHSPRRVTAMKYSCFTATHKVSSVFAINNAIVNPFLLGRAMAGFSSALLLYRSLSPLWPGRTQLSPIWTVVVRTCVAASDA